MSKKRRAMSKTDKKAYDNRAIKKEKFETTEVSKRIVVPITKAEDDERLVSGVVLQPDVVDAHGDIMSADVIKRAAHEFLSKYNQATKLGVQHSDFTKDLELLESYVAPQSMLLGAKVIKKGSWIVTVRVNDDNIWKLVKTGKITGFSIGGRAIAKDVVDDGN